MRILITGQCTLHWGRMEYGNLGNYAIIEPFVRELHRAVLAALVEPEVKERFKQLGLVAVGNTPEEFREIVRRDVEKYRRIVKESGIPQL